MRYYLVDAQFSHVSENGYIIKTVPTVANNGKEAAYNVRKMPRVKHHQKYAILNVKPITKEEYDLAAATYKNDAYFQATNRQEQNRNCPEVYENVVYYRDLEKERKTNKRDNISYKLKKYKIVDRETSKYLGAYSY